MFNPSHPFQTKTISTIHLISSPMIWNIPLAYSFFLSIPLHVLDPHHLFQTKSSKPLIHPFPPSKAYSFGISPLNPNLGSFDPSHLFQIMGEEIRWIVEMVLV
jgi:hypothetical protein